MSTLHANFFKSLNKLQILFLVSIACFFCYWIFQCLNLIYYPFPTEYRDYGGISLSDAIYGNLSPYSFSSGPPYFYIYGFLFSLLVGGLNTALNVDIFLLTKVCVFLCVILSALVIAYEVFDICGELFLAIMGFAMTLWTGAMADTFFILQPASFGLLVVLLTLSIIRKSQTNKAIFIVALGTVLAFYTKQYFLYVSAPIFLFLMFSCGLRKAFLYSFSFLVVLGVSIALINVFFPAYFYASILAQFNVVGGGDWGHARAQFIRFCDQYWPLITLLMIYIWKRFRQQTSTKYKEEIYLYVLIIAAVCLIPLGKNIGAFLSYYYQLALPSLIVVALISLSRIKSSSLRIFFKIAILVFSIFHGELMSFEPMYSKQALNNWVDADQLIKNTPGSKLISTPILVSKKEDVILLDNGHSECYVALNSPSVLDPLFPARQSYFDLFKKYYDGINNKIAQKEFGLIAVSQNFHPMISQSDLDKNYFKLKTIDLQTGRQIWKTEFWVPKKDD